jgi:O-antigen/teichoic acid export membrane protein
MQLPTTIAKLVGRIRKRYFQKGSLGNRFAGAVFWSFAGVSVSNAAGLVTSVALARIMGREGYGEVGVLLSTLSLLSQLGGLGLGVTAVKYAAQLRCTQPTTVGSLLGTLLTIGVISYAAAAAVIALFAPELAAVVNRPSLCNPIRFSGLLLLIQGIDSIQVGILAGFEAFKRLARVTMLRVGLSLPLSIACAYLFGLYGLVGALIISGLFTLLLNRHAVDKALRENNVYLQYGIDLARLNTLWEFSLPAFISATLTVGSNWGLNAMIVNQKNGYLEMGIYNAAYQWRAFAILIPGVCNSVVLAIQANLHASNDQKNYYKSIVGNLVVQCLVAAVVVGILISLAPMIMKVYGGEYSQGSGLLIFLALGWFFLTPNWILWNAMISSGKVWWGLLLNSLGVGILFLMASRMKGSGARGIALALLFSSIIQVGLQFAFVFGPKRNSADA